jgi:hypothetical protein
METYGHPGEPPSPVHPRLATLRVTCAGLLFSSTLMGILSWVMVEQMGVRAPVQNLPGLPLSLTVAATILLLLGSRLRSGLLRRVPPPGPDSGAAGPEPAGPEPVLAAYQRATLVSFALFESAAILGLILALITGQIRYGLILSLAAVLSMLVRWPRQAELERLLRRRGM